VASGRPCLLVGDPGTSKTVTASSFLGSLDAGSNSWLAMAFSSTTSSMDVQRALEERTEKRTKVGAAQGLGGLVV
jgi:dynein heavy chain